MSDKPGYGQFMTPHQMNHITILPQQCRLLEFGLGTAPPLRGYPVGIEISASSDVHTCVFDEENVKFFTVPETRGAAKPILSWIGKRCHLALDGLPPVFFVSILSLNRKHPTDIAYFIGTVQLDVSHLD